jgi:hypothetical protein
MILSFKENCHNNNKLGVLLLNLLHSAKTKLLIEIYNCLSTTTRGFNSTAFVSLIISFILMKKYLFAFVLCRGCGFTSIPLPFAIQVLCDASVEQIVLQE